MSRTALDDALLARPEAGPGQPQMPLPDSQTEPNSNKRSKADAEGSSERTTHSGADEKEDGHHIWPHHIFHGLTPHHVREHPGFKRNKLTLLSMGIAVVLVANVTFLGFLTPPKSPRAPLLYYDLPDNHQLDAVSDNGFINLILNKTATRFPNGTLNTDDVDYSKLTLDEYAAMFVTVDQNDFCPYHLNTAFLVFNGFAFSFAVATLFLVAVVPVFIRRQHWDAYLARVGAVSMSITLIFFVVAFLLAGFITAGVGQTSPQQCDYVTSQTALLQGIADGRVPNSQGDVLTASAYATLAMICLLIIIVTVLSLKEGKVVEQVVDDIQQHHQQHQAAHEASGMTPAARL